MLSPNSGAPTSTIKSNKMDCIMSQTSNQEIVTAFQDEITNIANACVGCGKCYEVCPIVDDAGLGGLNPKVITSGVRDSLTGVAINEDSQKWAQTCVLSGNCISACEYGVNPRLMLTMARMVNSEQTLEHKARLSAGVNSYNSMSKGVKVLSKIQLSNEELKKLGQGEPKSKTKRTSEPEYLFHTGCNVLKTPHIALLCIDIMDMLKLDYEVKGGPESCCGILHYRAGDLKTATRVSTSTINQFSRTGATTVLSWCPTCQVQFTEVALPSFESATNTNPFQMTPFVLFLEKQLYRLKPMFKYRVEKKVALHLHPGVIGLPEAAKKILDAIAGIEIIDLNVKEIGLMSNSLNTLPVLKKDLHLKELEAAEAAGVDVLAAVYHADHRELCAHEKDWSFEIINILEIIAESMGIKRRDKFKEMKLSQDVEVILNDLKNQLYSQNISKEEARLMVQAFIIDEQPLPLKAQRNLE